MTAEGGSKAAEGSDGTAGNIENVDEQDHNNDLREHMVGILFSRSKLTHLQKQVKLHLLSEWSFKKLVVIWFLSVLVQNGLTNIIKLPGLLTHSAGNPQGGREGKGRMGVRAQLRRPGHTSYTWRGTAQPPWHLLLWDAVHGIGP